MRNTEKSVVEKHIHSSERPLLQPLSFPLSPSLAKAHEQHQEHDAHSNTKLQLPSYIIYINVGGRVFTTTIHTMQKSALFNKLLSQNAKSPSNHSQSLRKRETTFESYCNEYKEKEEHILDIDHEQHGIYQINASYYFVDRSPSRFDDILHYLRNSPTISATQFIERYCGMNNISHEIPKLQSLSSVLSASSCARDVSPRQRINVNLLKLQDEARFYELDSLVNAVQEKLDFNKYNKTSFKWWDRTGSLSGLRRISGTKIAFATAMDNWVDIDTEFEIPAGFVWATQSEYLQEYHSKRDILSKNKEWIRFGIGDWDNYRWKYLRKVGFIFTDTFKGLRFIHSGMEVCDVNHVKSLVSFISESQLMEFDESKGIVEGFAGLVLLSDEVWTESPPSEASSWTSDEDDEQIQSLKKQTISFSAFEKTKEKNDSDSKNEIKEETPKTAKIASTSNSPQLATALDGNYRKRSVLTKNNLIKHTEIERDKHEMSKQRQYKSYKHQPLGHSTPHYIHHELPRFNYIATNQLISAPPAPQLMPHLSVNSLPAPNTSHHHILKFRRNEKE